MKYQASGIKHQNEGDTQMRKTIKEEEVEYLTCKIAHNYKATSPCLQTNTRECQDHSWHCCRLSDMFPKERKAALILDKITHSVS